jgi:hypothetical protein
MLAHALASHETDETDETDETRGWQVCSARMSALPACLLSSCPRVTHLLTCQYLYFCTSKASTAVLVL